MFCSCYEEKKGVEAGGLVEREETPEELMAKAGYKLVKCETIDDILQFAHYYQPTETLCTFGRAVDRLKECEVFFDESYVETVDGAYACPCFLFYPSFVRFGKSCGDFRTSGDAL